MIKHINKLMFLFAILVLASCIKDSEEFVPINGERSVTGDIFGIVTDTIGQPVEGALVFFGSRTKTTNQLGVYQFKNVKIDVKHNFLNIEKAGYFKATKTFRSVKEKSEILLKTLLMAKDFDRSINSEEGGIVEKGRTTLTFPAGSIVDEATGELYSGEVKVALQFLYPNDALIDQMMPGDLTAVDKDGIYSVLTSFGMNYVELQSESGAKLQIKEGKSVTMTSNVPLALLDDAPSEIKMWSFDTNTGLWKEEGVGQLSDGAYTGEVTHFSCWNYDSSLRSIIVNGRVVDQDGNP
ncbi:MAG: carboxypeptidase-like regulatory domain-containing protein, partial [Saprospiraceae bacterium]